MCTKLRNCIDFHRFFAQIRCIHKLLQIHILDYLDYIVLQLSFHFHRIFRYRNGAFCIKLYCCLFFVPYF